MKRFVQWVVSVVSVRPARAMASAFSLPYNSSNSRASGLERITWGRAGASRQRDLDPAVLVHGPGWSTPANFAIRAQVVYAAPL